MSEPTTEAVTFPCIWCGISLDDCYDGNRCCPLNDHPFARASEAILAIRLDEAEDAEARADCETRLAALREAAIQALESEALYAADYHRLRRALFPDHLPDEMCYCDGCYELLAADAR